MESKWFFMHLIAWYFPSFTFCAFKTCGGVRACVGGAVPGQSKASVAQQPCNANTWSAVGRFRPRQDCVQRTNLAKGALALLRYEPVLAHGAAQLLVSSSRYETIKPAQEL